MFQEGDEQKQSHSFDPFQITAKEWLQELEMSWAGEFYREIFCRIDEAPLAPLYSDEPSQSTVAVGSLVGAEILKAGFGWSDQDLYDDLQFNLQTRYALGLCDLNTMPFELPTLYNFRRRLCQNMQESRDNLLERALVRVTDEQLASLNRKPRHPHIDWVMLSNSIRQMNRLHLSVEVLQQVWGMLTEKDQAHYAVAFEPYPKGTPGQHCYRLKPADVPERLTALGRLMRRLVKELNARYEGQHTYQLLERVYEEHFALTADPQDGPDQARAIAGDTWDPENGVQLTTRMPAAPNPTVAGQFVVEGLWTDDGYDGSDAEAVFQQEQVQPAPADIRSWRTPPERFGLERFSWEVGRKGTPATVKCPGGQQAEIKTGRKTDRFAARFEQAGCETCAFAAGCPARPVKRRGGRSLNVSLRQVQVALLRQRAAQTRRASNNE